jgi:Flp pilus assembly protein TadD
METTSSCLSHLRLAISCHKRNDFSSAESNYRKALDFGAHPGARILLANLLLATSPSSPTRRAEALSLAQLAVDNVESRSADEQWKLSARYAYFLLQFGGFIQMDGEQPDVASFGISEVEKKKLLSDAISSLQRVTTLQPGYTVAWRNLCIALTAAGRLDDAEVAASKAIDSARNASSSSSSQNSDLGDGSAASKLWELLYKHGKALKRMGRSVEALSRYCEACEASNG